MVSNLSETPSSLGTVTLGQTPPANYYLAQAFKTGSQESTLDYVYAVVGNATGSLSPIGELRASTTSGDVILTADGLLTTFSIPDLNGSLSTRTFTPAANVSLAADTTYFFTLHNQSASGTFEWSYTESMSYTGLGSIPATKTFFYEDQIGPASGDGSPQLFEVGVTPVPEPGGWAMLCSVIGVLAGGIGREVWTSRAVSKRS